MPPKSIYTIEINNKPTVESYTGNSGKNYINVFHQPNPHFWDVFMFKNHMTSNLLKPGRDDELFKNDD